MMHQYIGARYVPIFYVNSQNPDSSEWENNVEYEPLVWVSLPNGNMYLSKKTVPAAIGSPASNPNYWMTAGQFNAYIQLLQDQINDMQDGTVPGSLQDQINDNTSDITALSNKTKPFDSDANVVFIGDSWGVQGIASRLNTVMGFNSYFNACNAGSGFVAVGDPPAIDRTFENLLTDLCGTMTTEQKNSINYLIVEGGLNDIPYVATLEQAIKDFIDTAVTLLPNAKIVILAVNHEVWGAWSRFDYVNVYNAVNGYKGAMTADVTKQMKINEYYNAYHLSTYNTVTNAIINAVKGLPLSAGYAKSDLTFEITALGVTNKNIKFYQNGKDIVCEIQSTYWSDDVNGYQGGLYLEFDCPVSGGYMPIVTNYSVAVPINIYPFGGSAFEECTATLVFSPGKFHMTIYGPANRKIQSLFLPSVTVPIKW